MIGDMLNDEQVAALQALANICKEWQVASYDSLARSVNDHRNCRDLGDLGLNDDALIEKLKPLYEELAAEGLVELKTHKGKPVVMLTQDGYRCNRIQVL